MGKEPQMKSLPLVLLALLVLIAAITLVTSSCSDSKLADPVLNDNSITSQPPNDFDGVGPEDEPDGDPLPEEFFSFDEAFSVETKSGESNVTKDGGEITIYAGGYHHFRFPESYLASPENITITIQRGFNKEGDRLEIYTIAPLYVGYEGSFSVEIETGIETPSTSIQSFDITLYRSYKDEFYEEATGILDHDGNVTFQLNQSSIFAVISKTSNDQRNENQK
jgi:hypothetical protein